jgi:tRNA A-37 threonylcarbamoyl transferase component Bud32/tetratricopeptide (TPR) repeat protein
MCPNENVLSQYVSRQLDAEARRLVELHLDACGECLRVVAAMVRLPEATTAADTPGGQRFDPGPGAVAGRYRIEDLLGEGGMGTVYRAFDDKLDRRVALKVVRGDRLAPTAGRERMAREAKTMAKLAHPNVVTVYDTGEVADGVYIAMELIEGSTLAGWLREARRGHAEIVRAFVSAGRGLAAAHAVGVVHRDFKPENVLVGRTGRVAVTDFGLAARAPEDQQAVSRAEREPPSSHLTRTGTVLGTPRYMSPEQHDGAKVDARSDQYSFAVALYEALFGAPPFATGSPESTRRARETGTLRNESQESRVGIPLRLRRALRRALARAPEERFRTLDALLEELEPYTAAPARRRTVVAALVGLGLVAAVVGTRSIHREARAGADPISEPSSDAAPRVVTLLDLPMPASGVPEALEAYREGLVEQHDAVKGAYKLFQRAAAKDPALAAAYLRHAMFELSTEDPDRQAASLDSFRHAVAGRDRLTPRDRGVVDALAPAILGQPADWAACEERLRALTVQAPMDENLFTTLGQVLAIEGKLAESDAAFAHALELDPRDVGTLALRADQQLVRGDLVGAGATAEACVGTSLRSNRCISTLFFVRSIQGRCRENEALSQRLITVSPDDIFGYLDLHETELALGEPDETVRATEERLIGHTEPADQAWARLHYPWLRAVLEGDFARANELIDKEAALAVEGAHLADHLRALHDTAVTAMETGDMARAGRAADAYLKRKRALPPPTYVTRNGIAREHVPAMLAIARRAGILSADDARRQLATWLDEWRARLEGREAAYLWLQAYAMPAETREEADEALARAPEDVRPLLNGDELEVEAIGRVDALAGRFAEAIPLLENASRRCRVRRFPLAIVRAAYYLGLAREGVGDKTGACEAYGHVLARWGKGGKVKSTTAELAGRQSRSLRCGP